MSDAAADAPENADESGTDTLGSRLRARRESRQLSIEKIADELRIEEHVLRALEDDRLADINVAPVFLKGYIKQYGRLLNLDYEQLLDAYRRQADGEDIRLQPNRAIQLRDERQITIWIIAGLAIAVVVVALFAWWVSGEDRMSGFFGASDDADNASVAAPVLARPAAPPRSVNGPSQTVAEAVAAIEAAAPSRDAAAPAGAADEPEPAARQEPSREPAAGAPEESPPATETAAPLAASETVVAFTDPDPDAVVMLFEFSRESWFELSDANGRRLHYDLAAAGSRLSFMALPPATVVIGDADAVDITVASVAHPVPASSLRGNVASFVIEPAQD